MAVCTSVVTSLTPLTAYGDIAEKKDARPNVVLVIVDDLRVDEFGAGGHPYLETPAIDSIVENGAMFNNAYHTTPLCSPNRATMLTGQYPSRHGIVDNTDRALQSHKLSLFAKDLQNTGYQTAHIGKWHMGNDPTPRSGYDYWVSYPGQGRSMNPILYEDGKLVDHDGYMTDILTDRTVSFIQQQAEKADPFFVTLSHKAVHPDMRQLASGEVDPDSGNEFVPAPRHKGVYAGKIIERTPSHGRLEKSINGKIPLKETLELRDQLTGPITKFLDLGTPDETIQARAEMVLSIDEGMQRIFDQLKTSGIADNTMVILTSDNGYWFGEHDLSVERRLPYQEVYLIRKQCVLLY